MPVHAPPSPRSLSSLYLRLDPSTTLHIPSSCKHLRIVAIVFLSHLLCSIYIISKHYPCAITVNCSIQWEWYKDNHCQLRSRRLDHSEPSLSAGTSFFLRAAAKALSSWMRDIFEVSELTFPGSSLLGCGFLALHSFLEFLVRFALEFMLLEDLERI